MKKLTGSIILALVTASALSAFADQYSSSAHVYTMTNAANGNEIIEFRQDEHKGLVETRRTATRGNGTGAGLGNQGGIIVEPSSQMLYAVNAGSNTVSAFEIRDRGLRLVDVHSSLGERPVSLTIKRNLLYVLNAGSDSIAGLEVGVNGRLSDLPNSVRKLSGVGTAPAQISFAPWGDTLVVTEKATNAISTFKLNSAGLPGDAIVNFSVNTTPFGFGFDRRGHLLVTEAVGGSPDASTVSSYSINQDGTLAIVDPAVPTTETAACWLITSANGRYAFTTNAGSSTISSFLVRKNGTLKLTTVDGVTATTGVGSAPLDMILSSSGQQMFVLSAANGTILSYDISNKGQLTPIDVIGALPTTINGLASY